jgi:hypothetical protein
MVMLFHGSMMDKHSVYITRKFSLIISCKDSLNKRSIRVYVALSVIVIV